MICFKKLIIGRASHWEIEPNDFTSLSQKMFDSSNNFVSNSKYDAYINTGKNSDYLNVLFITNL